MIKSYVIYQIRNFTWRDGNGYTRTHQMFNPLKAFQNENEAIDYIKQISPHQKEYDTPMEKVIRGLTYLPVFTEEPISSGSLSYIPLIKY